MFRLARNSMLAVLLLAGCAAPMKTARTSLSASPDETFSCYMRLLSLMEYRVEDSDRDRGSILARKETGYALSEEATIAIEPASDGGGSEVSVTIRRTRATRSHGVRSGPGTPELPGGQTVPGVPSIGSVAVFSPPLDDEGQRDLEALAGACTR